MDRPLTPRQQELVATHADLARVVAAQFFGRIYGPYRPEWVHLQGVAEDGLILAGQRFREGDGVPFRIYAWGRIRAAVIDYLRQFSGHTYEALAGSRRAPLSMRLHFESPEDGYIRRIDLKRAMGLLSERHRTAVQMRIAGENHYAIGARLGVHNSQASRIVNQSIAQIREAWFQ